ncbi:MAG: hypothetical protein HFE90_05750 [Firmicutes bacterium]|nr:hypothetical protein [Bacillota bacterium]
MAEKKKKNRWYTEIFDYIGVYGKYRVKRLEVIVEGLNSERAISRIIDKNIYISKIKIEDEMTVSFLCSSEDYSNIKKVVGKNYVVSVRQAYGIVPYIHKFMDRKGIIAGIMLIMAMLAVQQSFVCEIEISGNNGIDETEIRKELAKAGLTIGARKSDIDEAEVKGALFAGFDDITWINIDEQGGYVLVELIEGDKVKAEEDKVFHDIVAAKSGYIESLIAKKGFTELKEGDYVNAGDILINSRVPINNLTYDESRNDTYRQVDAQGEITARVVYKLKIDYGNGNYSEDELRKIADDKIKEYIRENITEYIETSNKNLNFTTEENIIKCIVTLEVIERIDKLQEAPKDIGNDEGLAENENRASEQIAR